MAKKRETKSSLGNQSKAGRTRIVKVFLNDEEIKQVRVAAVLLDVGVGEFARAAALEKAAKVLPENFHPKS